MAEGEKGMGQEGKNEGGREMRNEHSVKKKTAGGFETRERYSGTVQDER